MKYTTIRIEGSILSPDILEKIDSGEQSGQTLSDFNLTDKYKNIKEFINITWAKSLSQWEMFKKEMDDLPEKDSGTTTTRKHWMIPLLDFLGYKNLEYSSSEKVVISGVDKSYNISHREENYDKFPVHIIGFRDSLDKKKEGRYSVSPHSMVQEYLNVTEHLYAIVTNGKTLRILRDSSRLVKLSFVEFDLERMFDDKNFTDFALMFRLIHASRMPQKMELASESILEKYHQNSLDLGSTIRKGLSACVKESIEIFAEGFLKNSDNIELREKINSGEIDNQKFYADLLHLIYRILFLMVIEERDLVYPQNSDRKKKDIYYNYYSVNKLRNLSSKTHTYNNRYRDLWMSLLNTFKLFESEKYGSFLHIKPLSGSLFSQSGIGELSNCYLDNECLLTCFEKLSYFWNENIKQKTKINYALLNVEEFGSVYEGLLEYETKLIKYTENDVLKIDFELVTSDARSSSGSHYTPDELVQPLIKNSLDHIIEDKLKETDKVKALLSIKVCDVACGSGHILLSAARRIATELAKVKTNEDQPSPSAFREAVREVIRYCIYGVDKNPLAVELCKVALWLEAHNPGEPLNFLDHHIKCGDAIVGLAHKEELENGIADEAFKKLAGDDGEVTKVFSKKNREQRKKRNFLKEYFDNTYKKYDDFAVRFAEFQKLPESSPEEIINKQREYIKLFGSDDVKKLKVLADMQVAQFFIPKTTDYETRLVTDAEYLAYLSGKEITPYVSALSESISAEKRFFHWFLEFPEVFAKGGFDCILGNPPYLGGKKISGNFGNNYLEYLKCNYSPAGGVADYVTYFLRRIFDVIRENGFLSIITTNTIAQGETREGGLDVIIKNNGNINFAIRTTPWIGLAAVEVSLLSIFKGRWNKKYLLDNKEVNFISTYFSLEQSNNIINKLKINKNKSFQGSIILGDGFILLENETKNLIYKYDRNKDIIFPYINGKDLNSSYNQSPSRYVINFFDWSEEKCRNEYIECYEIIKNKVKPQRDLSKKDTYRKKWWQYAEKCSNLYLTIKNMSKVLAIPTQATKYMTFEFLPSNIVFSNALAIIALDNNISFSILNSCIHQVWSDKTNTTMKNDLRYNPTDCFQTFPFPLLDSSPFTSHSSLPDDLEQIGQKYHDFRKSLMYKMKLGLTDTYNLFHKKDLSVENIIKTSKQDEETCKSAYDDVVMLRQLHKQMDNTVLKAYGWTDIDLAHDFYEVDYLPENDRVRYTISPEARKEVLKRLLLLNHQIHEMEERGEKVNSILNYQSDNENDLKQPVKQLSLIDEPEQISMFD